MSNRNHVARLAPKLGWSALALGVAFACATACGSSDSSKKATEAEAGTGQGGGAGEGHVTSESDGGGAAGAFDATAGRAAGGAGEGGTFVGAGGSVDELGGAAGAGEPSTGGEPAGGAGGATSTTTKYVFTTSQLFTGDLGGLVGADLKCKAAADSGLAPLHGRAWKAWLSDSTTSPAQRFSQVAERYVLPDGTLVAYGWPGLVSLEADASFNGLRAPIDQSELGTKPPNASAALAASETAPAAWTWTREHGEAVEPSTSGHKPCQDWTSSAAVQSLPNVQAAFGLATNSGGLVWTYATNVGCNALASLYCFEQ